MEALSEPIVTRRTLSRGVREIFLSDTDAAERIVLAEVERRLGKRIGEVSETQVVEVFKALAAQDIGTVVPNYYFEFLNNLQHSYASTRMDYAG